MKQHPFGRRAAHRPISLTIGTPAVGDGEPHAKSADDPENAGLEPATEECSLDDELREWKQARRKNFRLPWRQFYLMASLCFGIGALVLPDSINRTVQWLLMALAALSSIAGFSKRRKPLG